MRKKLTLVLFLSVAVFFKAQAQNKITFDNVRQTYIRNSGQIMDREELKGYFSFYITDKKDRKTNAYMIQILDNNLNKVKEIEFEDDKDIQILESSYNNNAIMFVFYNSKENTLEYRSYGFDGKIKSTYTKELDKRSEALLVQTYNLKAEEGQNQGLFSVGDHGFTAVFPIKEKKYYSYEINFFFTMQKKQWAYEAVEEQEDKVASAAYLGATDSLVIFEVLKKNSLFTKKMRSYLLGLNIFTGKKAFEISTEEDEYKLFPMNISTLTGKSDFMVLGTYYDKDDRIAADKTLGLGVFTIDGKGKITSKKYNSWANDFGKFLNVNSKGKIDDIGYLYFHKLIQTSDGKIFAIGEGYKKVADGVGIALNILSGGGGTNNTKMKITDLVFIQFNNSFGLENASIYEKRSSSLNLWGDLVSPHILAAMIKAYGGFDYSFTQTDKNHDRFYVGYDDYEKSENYKGRTFNTISYADGKITTDKVTLDTKAKWMKIFPAKTGSVMIMEYFKKEKKLEMRLEKMN